MNDNLHSVPSSAMQRTESPVSISSAAAETALQSPSENLDAETKRVRALAQARVELEHDITSALEAWKPLTAEQEAIIQRNVDSGMKVVERMMMSAERMEMADEAWEKEWELKTKAWDARYKEWQKRRDESEEASKLARDLLRAKLEASWKKSESRMKVIPQRWNKMKAARRQFWDSMNESYNRRRELRLKNSADPAALVMVELPSGVADMLMN